MQVTLPAIVHRFEVGHTLRLVVSSTDQALRAAGPVGGLLGRPGRPTAPRSRCPQVRRRGRRAPPGSARWWVLLGVARRPRRCSAGPSPLLWGRRRRRRVSAVEPDGEDVPLRFEGVTKAYKDGFVAVRDLSFEVRRGQVLGLLGPNGAGKTTSLRMLMGLIRPTEGRISIFGHAAAPGRARAVPARLLRRGHRAAAAPVRPRQPDPVLGGDRPAARRTRTWRRRSRSPGSGTAIDKRVRRYSQGMRQRVAIAQAMLGLPDLLVLDEPTNGLDPPQIHAMREVLRSYAATGRTVIVSSHLLSEIEQTCSHVVVMAKGQKIAQGTVEEIVGTGGAVLIGPGRRRRRRPRDRRPRGAAGREPAERTDEGLVADLDGTSRAAGAAGAGRGRASAVDQFTPRRRLEDAFLALVGES